MDFQNTLNGYVDRFNNVLSDYLQSISSDIPSTLYEAINYSMTPGGKRIRPVLCYMVADMLGVDLFEVDNYAMAVEMIHSYSLVHDDLPCMDDDDYRRGKFSTHKQFGEATAVLTGDALLNLAVETCLNKNNLSNKDFLALKILFECSGASGMIKGQVLDLENQSNSFATEQIMTNISINKTSKLILAPILISSIMADNAYYNELKEYATLLGLLFQITDDILDVESTFNQLGKTPNKDEKADKTSAVKVYGLDGAKEKAYSLYARCVCILNKISNSNKLIELTEKIYKRKS